MVDAFNVFFQTIQIGEKLLHVSYSDYRDAFDFSSKYYSEYSDHFIDHFAHHSDLKKGEFELNLIRYFFIKAIECRIASDLYANTSRGNVCDIFWSPFDIALEKYPTNLPKHLEEIVNSKQVDALQLAKAVVHEIEITKSFSFCKEVLNAVQFIGQTIGYHIGMHNRSYKGYSCSDMLTRNELNEIAGVNLCNWLERQGFDVEKTNFTRDTIQNIVASKNDRLVYVLISAEIAPDNPGFIRQDLDSLYKSAQEDGAIPYYASVNLGSADNAHFKDGVLLFGDQTMFKINAFEELIAK